jgi:hypothetical protein
MGLLPGKRQPSSSLRLERDSGTRTFGGVGRISVSAVRLNRAPGQRPGPNPSDCKDQPSKLITLAKTKIEYQYPLCRAPDANKRASGGPLVTEPQARRALACTFLSITAAVRAPFARQPAQDQAGRCAHCWWFYCSSCSASAMPC